MCIRDRLRIPEGLSEMEVLRKMEDYAGENRIFRHIFRGAGAYDPVSYTHLVF